MWNDIFIGVYYMGYKFTNQYVTIIAYTYNSQDIKWFWY